MTEEGFLDVVEAQAKQGVDYMTVHCALLRDHVPLTKNRKTGIVSRGGSLVAKWMKAHGRENPFYTRYDDLCDILHEYDRHLEPGRRAATGVSRRRLRRGPVRGTSRHGRSGKTGVGSRLPGDD